MGTIVTFSEPKILILHQLGKVSYVIQKYSDTAAVLSNPAFAEIEQREWRVDEGVFIT